MTKRLIAATFIACLIATPASADSGNGDSGPYIGIGAGGQRLNDHYYGEWLHSPGTWDVGTRTARGFVGGVHGGYDHRSGALLIGAEADFALPGGRIEYGEDTWTYSARVNAQGSLRARLGVAAGPAFAYATGGLAVADIKHTYFDSVFPVDNKLSRAKAGYTLGGGVGIRVSRKFSLAVEYRFTDYGELATDVNTGWDSVDRNRDKTQSIAARISLHL